MNEYAGTVAILNIMEKSNLMQISILPDWFLSYFIIAPLVLILSLELNDL
jgi:hypothetical protein